MEHATSLLGAELTHANTNRTTHIELWTLPTRLSDASSQYNHLVRVYTLWRFACFNIILSGLHRALLPERPPDYVLRGRGLMMELSLFTLKLSSPQCHARYDELLFGKWMNNHCVNYKYIIVQLKSWLVSDIKRFENLKRHGTKSHKPLKIRSKMNQKLDAKHTWRSAAKQENEGRYLNVRTWARPSQGDK